MASESPVESHITGAYRSADGIDESVLEIASFAASLAHSTAEFSNFSAGCNLQGPLELVRVISAETQVVSGRNYKLKLELKSKGSDGPTILADVVVWDQPWTSTRKVTEAKFSAL